MRVIEGEASEPKPPTKEEVMAFQQAKMKEVFSRTDLWEYCAKVYMMSLDNLILVGFTRSEAMEIIKTSGPLVKAAL